MQNLRPLSGRQKPRTSWPRSKGAVSDWKKSPQDAQNLKNAWRKPHKNMYSYLRDGTLGFHRFGPGRADLIDPVGSATSPTADQHSSAAKRRRDPETTYADRIDCPQSNRALLHVD